MALLEKKMGKKCVEGTYLVYAKATEWLIRYGHGTTELNAKGHTFNSKIHFRTIGDSNDMS